MAARAGYVFIKSAITPELAERGASAIAAGLEIKEKLENVTEFVVPQVSDDIKQEFIKNDENKRQLSNLAPKITMHTIQSTGVFIYNESNADPSKPKTFQNDACIYVTIALTELSPDNGWFILLEGSHEPAGAASSAASWKQISLSLKPGDAVAWRGSLRYLHSSGGGGMFETLVIA